MAVLALSAIGAVAGNAALGAAAFGIAGLSGAAVGWAVGGMIGQLAFAPSQPDQYGPRQSDLKVQSSTVGQAIPLIFGSVRIAGNIIASSDYIETEHSQSIGGGKGGGGGTARTYSYRITVAIAICEGPIAGVERIWANSKTVINAGATTIDEVMGSKLDCGGMRIYLGTEDQQPDPALQALYGDLCPAFRGIAYVVFEDLELADFGDHLPNFEFEAIKHGAAGGEREMAKGNLKLEQLGPDYFLGANGGLVHWGTGGGGYGAVSSGFPFIASHDGGTFRVISVNYDKSVVDINGWPVFDLRILDDSGRPIGGALRPKNKLAYAVDYNGNMVSSETPSGEELMCVSRNESVDRSNGYYQFLGLVRGGALHPVQSVNIGSKSDYTIGSAQLGLRVYSPAGTGSDLTFNGLNETGRNLAGLYTSRDGYSLYLFTAESKTSPIDRWFKCQFTGASVMSVVESGGCDYQNNGASNAIPRSLIAGFGSSDYNAGSFGMMEDDGIHLWTGKGNEIRIFTIIGGRLTHTKSLAANGVHSSMSTIYVENGIAITAGLFDYAIYSRIGAMKSSGTTLGAIVSELCSRCDLGADELDVAQLTDNVEGFVVGSRMNVRSALTPLQSTFFFDGVESDGKLKLVKRGGPVRADIPEDDLAARAGDTDSGQIDPVVLTHAQEMELPNETTVTYFSAEGDYAAGAQSWKRQITKSSNTAGLNLAVVMSDAKAKQVAIVNCLAVWMNRNGVSFSTSRKYSHIEPCDVVVVHKGGEPLTVRIVSRTDGGDGVISFEAVTEEPAAYTQSASPSLTNGAPQSVAKASSTYLLPLDLAAISDAYAASPTLLMAAEGYTDAWTGAALFMSQDGGATFADTGKAFTSASQIGFAMTVLPPPATLGQFDYTSTLDVRLVNLSGALSSASELSVLNGANAAVLGDEIIQFKTATQIGPGAFRLSGLLRARRGTDWAAGSHASNERFVMLSQSLLRPLSLDSSAIGKTLTFKAPTFGGDTAAARSKDVAFVAENMRPLAPVYGFGYRDVSPADWHFRWIRRSRAGGDWRDYVDAPLSESSEKYDLEIYADSAYTVLKRTFSDLTTAEATYTAAQQVSDFGSAQARLFCKAYQKSDVIGRGRSLKFSADFTVPTTPPSTANLMLHFDGANGSTAIVDSSANALAFTATGVVALTDIDKKFGVTSLSMSGAYLSYVGNALDAGTGDYCYEGWFNLNTVSFTNTALFETLPPGGPAIADNRIAVGVLSGGQLYAWFNSAVNSHPVAFGAGVWNHVALQRKAGVITLFLNGVGQVLATNSAHNLNGGGFMIGAITENPADRRISGKIDEFRALIASAPYSGDFTPPTAPYA